MYVSEDDVVAPLSVTKDFLESLELVSPPKDTLHYRGRQLAITCKTVKVKVERDDPVEEYKVKQEHNVNVSVCTFTFLCRV